MHSQSVLLHTPTETTNNFSLFQHQTRQNNPTKLNRNADKFHLHPSLIHKQELTTYYYQLVILQGFYILIFSIILKIF